MGDLPLFSFMRSLFGVALDDVRLWGFEGKHPSVHGCLRGQSTVEGAFLIPVILLLLMLLIQPGILLFTTVWLCSLSASEGCRLISTRSSGDSLDAYEGYVTRRLGSVPQQKNFSCS